MTPDLVTCFLSMSGFSDPKALTGLSAVIAGRIGALLNWLGWKHVHPREIARLYLNRAFEKGIVMGGPFKGLRYGAASVGSQLAPKLLGSYECELNHVIDQICNRPPRCIVDVGAAEGYYAVGLAVKCAHSSVIAFEADARGRELLRQNAKLNGVLSRIRICGRCGKPELAEALEKNPQALVVMDVEGDEFDLLDPIDLPALRDSPILVELHPQYSVDITEEISGRFRDSHFQELIWQMDRTLRDLPVSAVINTLLGRWLILATSEFRPLQMSWLWMRPKSSKQ